MTNLETKIPPPLVALIFIGLIWVLSDISPIVPFDNMLRLMLSVAGVMLGFGFAISGSLSFKAAGTTINPLKPETTSFLVTSGVYRVSRNPMYVGMAFLLLAWTIYLAAPAGLLGVAGFIAYINRFQILPEEQALKSLFGAEFEAYLLSVRRWL
jgi:protein-S-isoprenylcysteine O-methyltransferase Ste14